jgi:flagellar hook-length control protein FliK
MTIAIVSTLVQPAARATASQSVARAGEATDEPGPATDFASLLLGVVAPPLTAGPASDETVPGESSLAAGDPALAAGLPPPALPTPTALRQEIESARRSRIETVPGTAADKPGDEPPMRLAANDEQRLLSGSPAWTAGEPPARIAVADFAGSLFERVIAKAPETVPPTSPFNPLPSLPGNVGQASAARPDLPTPIRDPSWASDFGQKLLWFASHDKEVAQLTLHPPQLGSIEITLKLDKDQASAHFVSANAEVRAVIEAATPRLREMFAGAGIELGQASVGSESPRPQSDSRQEASQQPRQLTDEAILGADLLGGLPAQSQAMRRGQSMVDVFA